MNFVGVPRPRDDLSAHPLGEWKVEETDDHTDRLTMRDFPNSAASAQSTRAVKLGALESNRRNLEHLPPFSLGEQRVKKKNCYGNRKGALLSAMPSPRARADVRAAIERTSHPQIPPTRLKEAPQNVLVAYPTRMKSGLKGS